MNAPNLAVAANVIKPPDRAAFLDWLLSQGYERAIVLPDSEMWAAIKPLLFHWTLNTGVIGDKVGYEGRWCFADRERARAAMLEWASRGFEDEPRGWRRHPETGRRRNDGGDPASEWIAL